MAKEFTSCISTLTQNGKVITSDDVTKHDKENKVRKLLNLRLNEEGGEMVTPSQQSSFSLQILNKT